MVLLSDFNYIITIHFLGHNHWVRSKNSFFGFCTVPSLVPLYFIINGSDTIESPLQCDGRKENVSLKSRSLSQNYVNKANVASENFQGHETCMLHNAILPYSLWTFDAARSIFGNYGSEVCWPKRSSPANDLFDDIMFRFFFLFPHFWRSIRTVCAARALTFENPIKFPIESSTATKSRES